MNKPVVVWQRAFIRIVAVDTDEDNESVLVMEELHRDALGGTCWSQHPVEPGSPVHLLMCEIASRVEVVPAWVRDEIRQDLEELEDMAAEEAGDAS